MNSVYTNILPKYLEGFLILAIKHINFYNARYIIILEEWKGVFIENINDLVKIYNFQIITKFMYRVEHILSVDWSPPELGSSGIVLKNADCWHSPKTT